MDRFKSFAFFLLTGMTALLFQAVPAHVCASETIVIQDSDLDDADTSDTTSDENDLYGDFPRAIESGNIADNISFDLIEMFRGKRKPLSGNVRNRASYIRGQMLMSRNDYAGALQQFEETSRRDPEAMIPQLQTAQCLFYMKQDKKALKILDDILARKDDYIPALLLQAQYYDSKSNRAQAVKIYERILELEPSHLEALRNAGMIYYQSQNDMDKTIQAYEAILAKEPKDIMSLIILGSAWAVKGNVEKSLDYYSTAVHYRPHLVTSFINLGKLFMESGNLDAARDVYIQAVTTAPDNEEIIKAFQSFLQMSAIRKYGALKAETLKKEGKESTSLTLRELLNDKELQDHIRDQVLDGYRVLAEDGATSNPAIINLYANALISFEKFDEAEIQLKRLLLLDPGDYKTHVALGNIFLMRHDDEAALHSFDMAIALNPDNTEVYAQIGAAYMDRQEYNKALDLYEKALRLKPDEDKISIMIFTIHEKTGDLEKAEQTLRNLVDRRPEKHEAQSLLGDLYRKLDKPEKALECYRQAWNHRKNSRGYAMMALTMFLELDRHTEAHDFANTFIEQMPRSKDLRIILGLTFSDYAQFDKALGFLEKAREEDPSNLSIYTLIASVYNRKKDYAAALRVFDDFARDQPEKAETAEYRESLAAILIEQNETERAVAETAKAASIAPENENIYLSWCAILNRKKDYKGSLEVLDTAFRHIDRKSEKGMFLEAQVLSGMNEYEKAEELYQILVQTNPENATYTYYLGLFYYETKRFDEAEKLLRQTIAQESDKAEAYNNLAYMFSEIGINLDEAEELVKKALILRPGAAFMIDTLGWIHFKKGNYENALKHLKRAESLSLDDPVLFDHIGDVLNKLERRDEAVEYWKRAFELDPDIEGLREKLGK